MFKQPRWNYFKQQSQYHWAISLSDSRLGLTTLFPTVPAQTLKLKRLIHTFTDTTRIIPCPEKTAVEAEFTLTRKPRCACLQNVVKRAHLERVHGIAISDIAYVKDDSLETNVRSASSSMDSN
jgi:hypothetical protein